MKNTLCLTASLSLCSLPVFASDQAQDMSDPLAVYTQAGLGLTETGFELKLGQAYDTGSDTTMAMNLLEIRGFGGEVLGWNDDASTDNAVDSLRFRNFGIDMTNGRGSQIDVSWDLDSKTGSASYSLIQALPAIGPVQFYPLAGIGLAVSEDPQEGYQFPGSFALVGLYSKITISENIWLNYNPFYFSTLGGSETYQDNAFGIDKNNILTHELVASYQLNPRQNLRLFANWNESVDFQDGDFRVEFNHQF